MLKIIPSLCSGWWEQYFGRRIIKPLKGQGTQGRDLRTLMYSWILRSAIMPPLVKLTHSRFWDAYRQMLRFERLPLADQQTQQWHRFKNLLRHAYEQVPFHRERMNPAHRSTSVSFNVTGLEAHGVARMLSNRSNVLVRSGFHCAQPLHETLELMPTVRASFYIYNQTRDIDALAEALRSVVAFL